MTSTEFMRTATAEAIREALAADGTDVNMRDGKQRTPLHDAAKNNKNPKVIEALLKAEADVNAYTADVLARGQTPLHYAARYNENPEVIEVLLKAGADVNARNADDKTPLDLLEERETKDDAYYDIRDMLKLAGAE